MSSKLCVLSRRLPIRLGGVLLVLFLAHASTARAQPENGADWDSALESADRLVRQGDCAAAWDVLWPWAKEGNTEARGYLAFAAGRFGMMPPSPGDDMVSADRYYLIIMVHGIPPREAWPSDGLANAMRGVLRRVIAELGAYPIGGKELLECLETDIDPEECISNAVAHDLVPSFESFAREVDAVSEWDFSQPARCIGGYYKLREG
jgi:hypothetical protein